MNNYEYNEGIEFNGLMPKVMDTEGIETIGASDFNAKLFENGHLGGGSLEVVDFFGTAFGGNGGEGGEDGGEGEGGGEGGDDSHEYVDLGLPSGTLWAAKNIQDSNGNELYFAWGETQGYTSGQVGTDKYFSWEGEHADYKYGTYSESDETNYGMTKYNKTDGKAELDAEDDAATVSWGSDWRMPTREQFIELITNTECEWTTVNDVQGAKFTSTAEGYTDKFLFFPAVGYVNGGVQDVGDYGMYWSVSLNDNIVYYACNLGIRNLGGSSDEYYRYCGFSVRPVRV